MAQTEYAVRLQHVTKTFGPVVANKDVSLGVRRGEILALLGENGSGKTTLMNMIAGIYYPDEGEIYVGDKAVTIRSPRDALDLGIGMIHQHFKLVDVFTATENIALSMGGGKFDLKKVHEKARAICEKYQFALDLDQKVYEMSVSQKQTLEIVKVLYRGADILILDEPTAVLTPQETERLFTVIRNMKADGKAVIIITHKLHEVLAISDRVAILRKGEYVGDIATRDADEATLTAMMVGEKVELDIERPEPVNPVKRLDIQHLTVRSADGITVLDDASFDVYGGEILGIAGISGNGQKELLEAIAGLQPTQRGASVEYYAPDASAPVQLIGKSPKAIREAGIHLSFVPEDRLGMGLVGSMGMTDNMMLKSYGKGHSPIVDRKAPHDLAETIKKELNVVTPDLNTPVSRLSGGNVQKVLVGRELAADPIVLMTAYAVRGLDINTSYTIYHLLNEQKKKGVAVIYVGEDLDVLLELCDRIVVLCGGKVNGILDGRKTTKEEVGNRMTNLVKEVKA
ncbi:ABC transporter ATP-binding protein [uncultured Gemmiger sp.]|mgnify:FL=1|uniref:ABC transporter ATP-binding protein n=1 Tax=uncultured Gemmiger sp. TaxID=1623490 RepID=UPI0025DBC3D8|nr:ABC transporter ATP-binding protein [uncultured Gemmiger sp.]